MTALAVHTDVVCPPDPTATCRHCGISLADHTTLGPDTVPTLRNAICLDDTALLACEVVWNRFEVIDGGSLDCPHVIRCDGCGAELCGEHSIEFVTCAESSAQLHHLDCRDECDECTRAMAADSSFEQWRDAS